VQLEALYDAPVQLISDEKPTGISSWLNLFRNVRLWQILLQKSVEGCWGQ
jgi:hypothetical protein